MPDQPVPPWSRLQKELLKLGVLPSHILIAFDFDGTLVEIVNDPESIDVPKSLVQKLERAGRANRLALCSGRSITDLHRFIGDIPGVDLIGNHGAETRRWLRGKTRFVDEVSVPEVWPRWRTERLGLLQAELKVRGGSLEDKQHSLALHYRNSGTAFWSGEEGAAFLRKLLWPGVRLMGGLACWNILPEGVSKGEAMLRYCRDNGYRALVYFGDETTDESVFELGALSDLEVHGVKVGPGETAARYRIGGVQDVRGWLAQLSMDESGLR